jgi:hypothetical protein
MTERRIIHVIRDKDGGLQATARGVHPLAALSWKDKGCEVFAFEIELPFQVAADVVQTAKEVHE